MHSHRTLPFIECRALKPSFVVNISITRGVHTQEGGKTHAGSWIKPDLQELHPCTNADCCLLHSWHSNHSHCCCHADNWDFHTVIKCSALLTKVWVITVSGRKFYSALTNYLSGKESMITLITALFLTQHVPLCYVVLLTGCICSPELKARHNYRTFCEYSK